MTTTRDELKALRRKLDELASLYASERVRLGERQKYLVLQERLVAATLAWAEQFEKLIAEGADGDGFVKQINAQVLQLSIPLANDSSLLPDNSAFHYALEVFRAVFDGKKYMRWGSLATALEFRLGSTWSHLPIVGPDGSQMTLASDVARPNGWLYQAVNDLYIKLGAFSRSEDIQLSANEVVAATELDLFGSRRMAYASVIKELAEENRKKEDPSFKRAIRGVRLTKTDGE